MRGRNIARSSIVVASWALLVCSPLYGAEGYPDRPVRLVVPQAAGGSTDFISRQVAQQLADAWGQTVVVDNRHGANGNIGMELAARAPKDGYTLLMGGSGPMAINPSLYRKMPVDPLKDFQAVTLIAYSTSIMFTGIASALGHIKAGKLKALSVNGPKRSAVLPEVPTAGESGLPGFEVDFWIGTFVPSGSPKQAIDSIHASIARLLENRDVREKLVAQGTAVVGMGPAEFAAVVKRDAERWGKVVQAAKLRIE
jgi:tripartite-type tricarboxylate transporter receptor subunit TctC